MPGSTQHDGTCLFNIVGASGEILGTHCLKRADKLIKVKWQLFRSFRLYRCGVYDDNFDLFTAEGRRLGSHVGDAVELADKTLTIISSGWEPRVFQSRNLHLKVYGLQGNELGICSLSHTDRLRCVKWELYWQLSLDKGICDCPNGYDVVGYQGLFSDTHTVGDIVDENHLWLNLIFRHTGSAVALAPIGSTCTE